MTSKSPHLTKSLMTVNTRFLILKKGKVTMMLRSLEAVIVMAVKNLITKVVQSRRKTFILTNCNRLIHSTSRSRQK